MARLRTGPARSCYECEGNFRYSHLHRDLLHPVSAAVADVVLQTQITLPTRSEQQALKRRRFLSVDLRDGAKARRAADIKTKGFATWLGVLHT